MPQSLAKNLIHLIYSTTDRRPVLDDAIREELHKYTCGILQDQECAAVEIGSVPDHLHLLFVLSKNKALADVVREVKRGTSRWLKSKGPQFAAFEWQAGYGAFSVSQSAVEKVRRYIRDQAEHHRKVSFQDELRAFLRRHGIEFDERYVWD